jgi:periplasmic protein TonB
VSGATVALSLVVHVAALLLVVVAVSSRTMPRLDDAEVNVAFMLEPAPAVHQPATDVATPEPDIAAAPPEPSASETRTDEAAPAPPVQDAAPVAPAPVQEALVPKAPAPSVPSKRTIAEHPRSPSHRTEPATASPSVAFASARPAATASIVPPRPVAGMETNRAPVYPESARRRGEQGRVMLQVSVSTDGTPLEVDVLATSGHPSLDSAALSAVRQWRFIPASQAGMPVRAFAEVPIRFRLEN